MNSFDFVVEYDLLFYTGVLHKELQHGLYNS